MAQNGPTGGDAREQVQTATRKASLWLVWFVRAGYAAYGVVYGAVGVLALQATFGGGGKTTSQEGVFRSILLAPLGRVLLALVTLGLLGYALWRLFQAIFDPDGEGTDARGIASRFDHGLNGVFHAILALTAGQLVLGLGGGGAGSPDDWTARLLARPLGRWLATPETQDQLSGRKGKNEVERTIEPVAEAGRDPGRVGTFCVGVEDSLEETPERVA